jgi:hypothetical protein
MAKIQFKNYKLGVCIIQVYTRMSAWGLSAFIFPAASQLSGFKFEYILCPINHTKQFNLQLISYKISCPGPCTIYFVAVMHYVSWTCGRLPFVLDRKSDNPAICLQSIYKVVLWIKHIHEIVVVWQRRLKIDSSFFCEVFANFFFQCFQCI